MSPTLSKSEIVTTQQEGYRAYLAGMKPTSNPYPRDSALDLERQGAWFRGYAASRTDRARANRVAAAEAGRGSVAE